MKKTLMILAIMIILSGIIVMARGQEEEPMEEPMMEATHMTIEGSHGDVWKLQATDPLLIGGYGDNFVYDGKAVVPLEGRAVVDVNAVTNEGTMVVEFQGTINPEAGKTYSGDIRIEYREFEEGSDFWEGGIADFIWLHGDTGQEAPVMPKVRTKLGSWGPADVYVNDELIYQDLVGHMMYTEGSRDAETYAIYNGDRSGFYSPKNPGDYTIAHPDKMELHFVAHTVEPDKGNFPPHTVWIHLNFQTIKEM